LKKVEGIDGLLCLLTDRIDGNLMATAGRSLKVISHMAVAQKRFLPTTRAMANSR